MKKSKLILGLVLASALSTAITGCKKDDKKATAETVVSAEDNSTAESEFTSMFDVGDDFASTDSKRGANTILPNGAIVNFSDSDYNDGDGVECTIDFGPVKTSIPKGILCQDGRYRSGVLHISATKRYFLDGAVVSIWATDNDGYYAGNDGVNLTRVSGSITLTRLTQMSLKIDVDNAKATNDKGTVTWESSRTITKTVEAPGGIIGDQFTIEGNASGVNRNGEKFTVTIDVPLLKKVEAGCARTFVVGKITLTNLSSGKDIKIDYDPFNNMACDLTAKATINNKEYFYTVR